jgi:hypothetical protein
VSKEYELVETKYSARYDEESMIRQSITEDDAIMVLCMEIAYINYPNIGGYYGTSGPLMNNFRNITHPEVCLFNVTDYPVRIAVNANYTSGPYSGSEIIDIWGTTKQKIGLFIIYETYFRECQKRFKINGSEYTKTDIVKAFFDTNHSDELARLLGEVNQFDQISAQSGTVQTSEMLGGGSNGISTLTSTITEKPKTITIKVFTNEQLISQLEKLFDVTFTKELINHFNNYMDNKDDLSFFNIVRYLEHEILTKRKSTLFYPDKSYNITIINLINQINNDLSDTEFVESFKQNPNKFKKVDHVMNIIFGDILLTPKKIIKGYNEFIGSKYKIDTNDKQLMQLIQNTFNLLYNAMLPNDSYAIQFYSS